MPKSIGVKFKSLISHSFQPGVSFSIWNWRVPRSTVEFVADRREFRSYSSLAWLEKYFHPFDHKSRKANKPKLIIKSTSNQAQNKRLCLLPNTEGYITAQDKKELLDLMDDTRKCASRSSKRLRLSRILS